MHSLEKEFWRVLALCQGFGKEVHALGERLKAAQGPPTPGSLRVSLLVYRPEPTHHAVLWVQRCLGSGNQFAFRVWLFRFEGLGR